MYEKVRLILQRRADGVHLILDDTLGCYEDVFCGSPSGRVVNDLVDAAVAAGEFIQNPEEVGA